MEDAGILPVSVGRASLLDKLSGGVRAQSAQDKQCYLSCRSHETIGQL